MAALILRPALTLLVLLTMGISLAAAIGQVVETQGVILYNTTLNDGSTALRLRDVARRLTVTRRLLISGAVVAYSPDLRYVAYHSSAWYPDLSNTYVLEIRSGAFVRLAEQPIIPQWSARGLLYGSETGLWGANVDASGAALHPAGLPAVIEVAASPDGQTVAVSAATGLGRQVLVLHERQALPVSGDLFSAYAPAFSPDGTQLAFLGNAGSYTSAALYVVPVAGGEPRLVLRGSGSLYRFRWSPDSRWIALEGEINADTLSELAVVNVQRGTINRYLQIAMAEWSPDGRQLVYLNQFHPCLFNLDTNRSTCLPEAVGSAVLAWR